MTKWLVTWQIARREIVERGRSPAYLITSLAVVVAIAGLIVIPPLLAGDEDVTYTIGSIGAGNDAIITSAEDLANATQDEDAPTITFEVEDFDDRATAETALDAGEIDAILVDGIEVVQTGAGTFFSEGGDGLNVLIQRGASAVAVEGLISADPEMATAVIEAMSGELLETTYLDGDETEDNELQGLVAYVGLMLLYVAIILYGTWILTGVTEEKANRVVEVILSSVRPWQLLAGKVAGIGLLGLTQFALTIATALVAVRLTDTIEIPSVSPGAGATMILWFLLGFALYAMMFAAAGALAGRPEDAQGLTAPLAMLSVGGMILAIFSIDNPEGPLALFGTYFPLTAPFVVPVRFSLEAIPVWQYASAVALTLLAIVGMTFLAGRIYAGGLLRFGSRTKLRDAWQGGRD